MARAVLPLGVAPGMGASEPTFLRLADRPNNRSLHPPIDHWMVSTTSTVPPQLVVNAVAIESTAS